MKFYVFVLSIICLSLSSCRKDRSCTCTVSTNGTRLTRSQTAGNTINIPPLPPVVIVAATDTTYSMDFGYATDQKTNYHKVSKRAMNKSCPSSYEESINDNSVTITPGTSTITVTNSGKKTYTCKIE